MVPIFQEKFRPKELTEPLDPSVRALLDHDAVHLLDERGIYYDQAIAELAMRVRRLLS